MNSTKIFAVALGIAALGACNKNPQQQAADNYEANVANAADTMEANVDNAADQMTANVDNASDAMKSAADNKSDEMKAAADNKADEIKNSKESRFRPARTQVGRPGAPLRTGWAPFFH